MSLKLCFAADSTLLMDPAAHTTLILKTGGQAIAVCRHPSKHDGSLPLFVTDPRSSRVHMIFDEQADPESGTVGWGVRDNGSTNGTFVNAQKLTAHTFKRLRGGDQVTVGKGSLLRWSIESDVPPAAAASASAAATAEAASPTAAARQSSGSNSAKKPRGRAPKGKNGLPKKWDALNGEWVEDTDAQPAPPPAPPPQLGAAPPPPDVAMVEEDRRTTLVEEEAKEEPPPELMDVAEPPAAAQEPPPQAPPQPQQMPTASGAMPVYYSDPNVPIHIATPYGGYQQQGSSVTPPTPTFQAPPPAVYPSCLLIYGLGLANSIGFVKQESDKKPFSNMTLQNLRKILTKQLDGMLSTLYPQNYLFILPGTTSPLQLSQEKLFRTADVISAGDRITLRSDPTQPGAGHDPRAKAAAAAIGGELDNPNSAVTESAAAPPAAAQPMPQPPVVMVNGSDGSNGHASTASAGPSPIGKPLLNAQGFTQKKRAMPPPAVGGAVPGDPNAAAAGGQPPPKKPRQPKKKQAKYSDVNALAHYQEFARRRKEELIQQGFANGDKAAIAQQMNDEWRDEKQQEELKDTCYELVKQRAPSPTPLPPGGGVVELSQGDGPVTAADMARYAQLAKGINALDSQGLADGGIMGGGGVLPDGGAMNNAHIEELDD